MAVPLTKSDLNSAVRDLVPKRPFTCATRKTIRVWSRGATRFRDGCKLSGCLQECSFSFVCGFASQVPILGFTPSETFPDSFESPSGIPRRNFAASEIFFDSSGFPSKKPLGNSASSETLSIRPGLLQRYPYVILN